MDNRYSLVMIIYPTEAADGWIFWIKVTDGNG